MNILNKISIRNLKLNKKRTISTIIGIILSTALICAVATMATSFQHTLVQNDINKSGYYHLKLYNVTDENIKTLKNNRDIKDIFTIKEVGYGKLENGKNEDKPYLKLYSMDNRIFNELKFKLTEGRFPNNNDEIVISSHIATNGKVNYKVGDKIKIDIGTRKTLEGYTLDNSNPYNQEGEQLTDTKQHEFTITGIIERPNYSFEIYSDPGYTIISTNINDGTEDAFISLKNPKEYKTSIANILGASNYNDLFKDTEITDNTENTSTTQNSAPKLNYEKFDVNEDLLRWEVLAISDDTIIMLYQVVGVVIFIIMLTSIFCIRNSFAIAITEKMKMYGMLASVGTTRKQIKKNVISETLMLGLIGIPLGILSGILAVIILIKIVNVIAGEILFGNVDGIMLKVSIYPIILSVVLGIVTIYLSALSSAKKASKVSPIDLLKNPNEVKLKSKKLKVPFLISKIFGTGGVLAYKNLKRSKKKYRTTVVSLAVSIFVFIAMSSFIANMFDVTGNYYKDYDYNISIGCGGRTQDEIDKISKLKNIDESYWLYECEQYLKINDLSKINNVEGIDLQEDEYYDENLVEYVPTGEGKVSKLQILALDNNSWNKYMKKIGANGEKLKNKGVLCDDYLYYEKSGKGINQRIYKYSIGDTITGKLDNKETSFKVGAITDIRPYGIEKSYYDGGYLIVNLDYYKDMNFKLRYISIQSSNPDGFVDELKSINIDNGYFNISEQVKEEKSMVLIIKIFLYGFITVITLIGVTNIFNTITSNMELRQKEFAMLKSIGMTKREFNRMINLETIFYSTKALIYGIALGMIGTFALYKAFSVKFESDMYIPVKPILISVIAVFILVFIIMRYSIAKINKQNTIETIRNENI